MVTNETLMKFGFSKDESGLQLKSIFKNDKIHFRKEVYFIMASKGQKFKKYSSNLKSMIIEELKLCIYITKSEHIKCSNGGINLVINLIINL